jgi:hypothetical protein
MVSLRTSKTYTLICVVEQAQKGIKKITEGYATAENAGVNNSLLKHNGACTF